MKKLLTFTLAALLCACTPQQEGGLKPGEKTETIVSVFKVKGSPERAIALFNKAKPRMLRLAGMRSVTLLQSTSDPSELIYIGTRSKNASEGFSLDGLSEIDKIPELVAFFKRIDREVYDGYFRAPSLPVKP